MLTKSISISNEIHSLNSELYEWALHKVKHYRRADRKHNHKECDFHARELLKLFQSEPCTYCGDKELKNKTLDRIDNHRGHTKDNVLVACIHCNTERNDKVSVQRFRAFNLMYCVARLKELNKSLGKETIPIWE